MQLKQIARIVVRFSPWEGDARSAREFLARITSASARASNPECKVEHQVRYVHISL
jgi:large subunit ribosomal protein L53